MSGTSLVKRGLDSNSAYHNWSGGQVDTTVVVVLQVDANLKLEGKVVVFIEFESPPTTQAKYSQKQRML